MNPQDDKALIAAPQQTETKSVTKFTAEHGREVGLPSPEAVNYMMSVANLLLNSSLITGDMGTTPEKVKANALAKMLVGHELQMQPMEALQDIDIVRGKVFVRYPQLINQIILRGFKWKWVERSNERAALEVTRPGQEPELFEFTIADAKMAGLTGGDSQYAKRPRVMLSARVVSEAYRMTGGRSNVYAPEEKSEVLASEPNEPESQAAPENGTQFKVGRKSAKTQAPNEVSSEPQSETGGGASPEDNPAPSVQTLSVQTSDKPPFDPTPESEPPLLKIVTKPVPAKPSDAPVLVTVKGIPDAKVHDYLRGFLNVTKVPKTHPNMAAAVEYLASLDPLLVLRDPYALGVDLRDWMNGEPFWGEKLSPSDLRAWLRVLARGGFKIAGQFREAVMEDGQPSQIIAQWEEAGMDLQTCSQDDIESALAPNASGPHSPAEALASAHIENPFAKLRS